MSFETLPVPSVADELSPLPNLPRSLYEDLSITFPRRVSREVRVGKVTVGGNHPVVVQSMITEETKNVKACVR